MYGWPISDLTGCLQEQGWKGSNLVCFWPKKRCLYISFTKTENEIANFATEQLRSDGWYLTEEDIGRNCFHEDSSGFCESTNIDHIFREKGSIPIVKKRDLKKSYWDHREVVSKSVQWRFGSLAYRAVGKCKAHYQSYYRNMFSRYVRHEYFHEYLKYL